MLVKTGSDHISTGEIATFVHEAMPGTSAIDKAVGAILDTLAVTVAGSAEAPVRALDGTIASYVGDDAVPLAWEDRSVRPDDAALLYGMASHVLDFDDVSMLAICHPSAPVLSALLACNTPAPPGGRAFCEAFIVGTEIMIRLGMAMNFRHYALGFHSTATLGTIGSAVACARLMGLDVNGITRAIGIAASSAGGLRRNFGSPVKSLHVGLAAVNGLRAARLAAAGLGGDAEPLNGEGFLQAFTGGETQNWSRNVMPGAPFAIDDPGFEQKAYPCCYMLHRMIDGTLTVREQRGLTLDKVASVRVDMPAGGTKPLIHPRPSSGLNALFSAPYAVVAALADGRVDLTSFTDAQALRPAIQQRLADIEVVEAEGKALTGSDLGDAPVTLTFTLSSGERFTHTVVDNPGSPAAPLGLARLEAKWRGCLRAAGAQASDDEAGLLFREGMEHFAGLTDVSAWLARLRGAILGVPQ